ncbi:hypothetical protein AAMO2058_000217200 [Amorphochlora amoebiformis]
MSARGYRRDKQHLAGKIKNFPRTTTLETTISETAWKEARKDEILADFHRRQEKKINLDSSRGGAGGALRRLRSHTADPKRQTNKERSKTKHNVPKDLDDMRHINVANIAVLQWFKNHRKKLPERITKEQKENYRRVFEMMDHNKSGKLDVDELVDAQRYVGISIDKTQALQHMKSMDITTYERKLNFEDFCQAFSFPDEWEILLPIVKGINNNKSQSRPPQRAQTPPGLRRFRPGSPKFSNSPKNSPLSQRKSSSRKTKKSKRISAVGARRWGTNERKNKSSSSHHKLPNPNCSTSKIYPLDCNSISSPPKTNSPNSHLQPRQHQASNFDREGGLRGFDPEKFVQSTENKGQIMPFRLWVPMYHRRQTLKGIVENGCAYFENEEMQSKMRRVLGLKHELWDKPSKRKFQGYHLRDQPNWENDLRTHNVLHKAGFFAARRDVTSRSLVGGKGGRKSSVSFTSLSGSKGKTERFGILGAQTDNLGAHAASLFGLPKKQSFQPTPCIKLRALPRSCYDTEVEDKDVIGPKSLRQVNHMGESRQNRHKFSADISRKGGLSEEWRFLVSKIDAKHKMNLGNTRAGRSRGRRSTKSRRHSKSRGKSNERQKPIIIRV